MITNNVSKPTKYKKFTPKNLGSSVSKLIDRISELEAERDILGHIIRRRGPWIKTFAAQCAAYAETGSFSEQRALQIEDAEWLDKHWNEFVKSIPDTGDKWCAYCGLTTDHSSGGCMRLLHDRNAALGEQNKLLHKQIQELSPKSK